MKQKHLLSICLLWIVLCGFSSCQDDPLYDDPVYEATEMLSYNVWIDQFRNSDGIDCEQQLVFNSNFTGREIMTYYDPFEPYPVTETYYFHWDWTDHFLDAIYIRYDDGYSLYFDELNIGRDHLAGYWDGTYVQFRALR